MGASSIRRSNITAIAAILACDRARGLQELAETIQRNEGNICKIAWELGIHRRSVYKIIYRAKAWAVVNAVRAEHKRIKREGPDWLKRTRKALRAA